MENFENLKVPERTRQHVREFVARTADGFGSELASLFAFGSAVTGDFDPQSDVNLMVVVSDLEIAELSPALAGQRDSIRKHRLAPRFISRRNLLQSAKYFQIDFLEMRDAHVLLLGEDLLAGIRLSAPELRWQIGYEIKAMRMRLKQQFWQFDGDADRMRRILARRFVSLVHIMRATLLLLQGEAPLLREEILNAAGNQFKIDRAASAALLDLRKNTKRPKLETLRTLFTQLMEMIRAVDDRIEDTVP